MIVHRNRGYLVGWVVFEYCSTRFPRLLTECFSPYRQCDRVLWRTHIYPDIIPESKADAADGHEGRLGRLGSALSQVLHRRHRERALSTGYLADHGDKPGAARTVSNGHEATTWRSPLSPRPKAEVSMGPPAPARTTFPIISRTLSVHSHHAPTDEPKSSSSIGDTTPPQDTSRCTSSAIPKGEDRPRSECFGTAALLRVKAETPPSTPRRRSEGPRSPTPTSPSTPRKSHDTATLPRSRTIGTTQDATHGHDEGETSFFSAQRKWFRDLPSILLHQRTSTETREGVSLGHVMDEVRVRQRGEVECLSYGTLDDAAMRRLEGRR
jgi:hypothetical protein